MTKTKRIKVSPLSNTIEFHAAVSEIAALEAKLRGIEAERDTALQAVNKEFDARTEPVAAAIKAISGLALAYAEAHRSELLPKDAKSVRLSFATFGWRTGNRTVALLPNVKAEHVINTMKAGGLADSYVRVNEEINREAILADCKDDKTLPYLRKIDGLMQKLTLASIGLRISQRETFYVEPVSATDAAETIKPEAEA
jgi:phage host-nuclease inhibitor protein Gam